MVYVVPIVLLDEIGDVVNVKLVMWRHLLESKEFILSQIKECQFGAKDHNRGIIILSIKELLRSEVNVSSTTKVKVMIPLDYN